MTDRKKIRNTEEKSTYTLLFNASFLHNAVKRFHETKHVAMYLQNYILFGESLLVIEKCLRVSPCITV